MLQFTNNMSKLRCHGFNIWIVATFKHLYLLCFTVLLLDTNVKSTIKTISAFHININLYPRRSLSFSQINHVSPISTTSSITEETEETELPHKYEYNFPPISPTFHDNKEDKTKERKRRTKTHYTTICICPSPTDVETWERLTSLRTELRDPLLHRWPPHINLLYPFITIKRKEEDINSIMYETLYNITSMYEPFQITLDDFSAVGNDHRGVLWLNPRCSSIDGQQTEEVNGEQPSDESNDILQKLQNDLQSAFPICHEQRKNGIYNPHMTLSHYPNLVQANNAKSYIESAYKNEEQPISFTINEIYLLKRFEPDGQFLIYAKLPLLGGRDDNGNDYDDIFEPDGQFLTYAKLPLVGGDNSNDDDDDDEEDFNKAMELYETNAQKFPFMPIFEEDWVYEERMKLKEQRTRPRYNKRTKKK